MELTVYDTLAGAKRAFVPRDPARVTLYVCGPTVYGFVHIGNGRPAVVFDVLYRVLRSIYPKVVYARNVTDIDDKINAAAHAAGESIRALSDRYTDAYLEDVSALGVLTPSVQPRATEHIDEIVRIIERLVSRGHAYAAEQHVLFDVPSDPSYGCLSRRSLADMLDGARVEIAPYKRDPKDFVLWKPSGPDQPGWESPWGYGRPGWHIECTAMISAHLGATIDIHGGGSDLTFPHHENEIAQGTSAADGESYVRYWMHNGMLNFGTEKMSKSLGNIVTIRGLLTAHRGEVLRYALLSGQYRSTLGWSGDLVAQSKASLDRLYRAAAAAELDLTSCAFEDEPLDAFPASIAAALCDDLNTPVALAEMHALAGRIQRSDATDERRRLGRELLAGGWLLGLLGVSPEEQLRGGDRDTAAIESLIAERAAARRERDYARADAIRERLGAMGVELEDTAGGTRWTAQ